MKHDTTNRFRLLVTISLMGWFWGNAILLAQPTSVTLAGSFQSELGCAGDWQSECAVTHMTYDAGDDVWQATLIIPARSWEYKATLNDSWDENYGAGGVQSGPNIALNLAQETAVKFYYDHKTHWITDNINSLIVTAPGSYQAAIGCAGDWDPSCLRSWLQDPDGDGIFSADIAGIPAGNYEVKATINESWDENYGAGGVPSGPNILFTVPSDCATMYFEFNSTTHLLTVSAAGTVAQPGSVTIPGNFQSEVGCSGDWQPECAATHLSFDGDDNVWQGTFNIPAGSWEYKAALNDSWDENYGANAQQNGPNIALNLGAPTAVKFYYDHATHWVTDNVNSRIVTAPGSYQTEIGCASDWDPSCLRTWLQDPDGDGTYTFTTDKIPTGNYEVKAAVNESWDENYGADGVPDGANIPFTVYESCSEVLFSFDGATNVLTVTVSGTPPACAITSVTAGSQSACDPFSNSYSQEVTVSYENAPGGDLIVNGQSFPASGSPQTVTLSGLTADGLAVDVSASFADDPGCSYSASALFTAPTACNSPEAIVAALDALIDQLLYDGALNSGQARALHNHLKSMLKQYDKGNYNAARSKVQAFMNQVNNFVANGILTAEQAQPLLDGAAALLAQIDIALAKANGSDLPAELPAQFELAQNYPNPFNPSTTIRFALPEAGHSVLRIYDNTGRLVKTLLSGYRNAGTYQVVWDATNDNGQRVASGMYLYRLVSGAHTQTRKMLLMR